MGSDTVSMLPMHTSNITLTIVSDSICRHFARACGRGGLIALCGLLTACAASPSVSGPDEAYVKEAWAYFKNKCETEAGEKIYKTYTGVKSVLVVKPLPPATEKDLYDQFWYGDPYSSDISLPNRGEYHASTLIRNQEFVDGRGNIGLEFFEQRIKGDGGQVLVEQVKPSGTPPYFISKSIIQKTVSRFGIEWEDISTPEDRKYWVAGSRLKILDLIDNSIVAKRIGYFIEAGFGATAGHRRPWQSSRGAGTTCPAITNRDFTDRWFVLKVLKPSEEKQVGK